MSTRPRIIDREDPNDSLAHMPDLAILPREGQVEVLPPRKLVRKEGFRAWSETNLPQDKPKTR